MIVAIRRCLCSPALLAFPLAENVEKILRDVDRWLLHQQRPGPPTRAAFLELFALHPEFRTLVYHRLRYGGPRGRVLAILLHRFYKGERTLHLVCPDIGGGLYLLHGYATIIDAESLGEDCFIGHGVTIGHNEHHGRPTLGRSVTVYSGATVIGPVEIGDRAKVATMSLVNRDVGPGVVVGGIPAQPLAKRADVGA